MGIFTFLILFMSIVANGVAFLRPKSDSPALSYWEDKLPNIPIPNILRELIVPLKNMEDAKSAVVKVGFQDIDPVDRINYGEANEMLSELSLSMFFLQKDLHYGTKMSLYLGNITGPQAYFLPRHLSDKIPFSSDKLSMALEDLNIPEGSATALAMESLVKDCEGPEFNGESKYCTTSLESMIDYSTSRLGTNHVTVLVTNVPKNSVNQQRNYTFMAVRFKNKSGSNPVVCHSQTYAYAVYHCHEAKNTTTVQVSLKGEDGTHAEGVALCHEDTSAWSPNHPALKWLNVNPGGPSVCHFQPYNDVLWLTAN